jgi:hypothetical protein
MDKQGATMNRAMKGLTQEHRSKLSKAIAYLRERKIYILEFPFRPTNAASTDVAQTIARYRTQIEKRQLLRGVK